MIEKEIREKYPNAEWGKKDGIVYVKLDTSARYTVWSDSKPFIVAEVDDLKDAPFIIKELMDDIEGWDEKI